MHDLFDGAVEHARASGASVIEGYPVEPEGDRVDQTSAYVGTVRLFEAHGFRRVRQTTGRSGGKSRCLVRARADRFFALWVLEATSGCDAANWLERD